ncbi:DMT family transporter [Micromonospora aurantiaca (nom. illeg.)]|uniref:DMT family transporter n=1 Tax=Micromonospora aurantiaca (nom. illeg.) TaxID=47850 RepID=UPI0033E2C0AA
MSRGGLMRFGAVALMWGSTYFWIKMALGGMNPTQFSLVRVAIGAVAMLAIVVLTGAALPRRPGVWLRLLLVAFLVNALPVLLVQIVPDATGEDVGVVSVFNASVPLWALLLAPLLRERAAGGRTVAGVLIGFAGVLLMFPPWEQVSRWFTWSSLINFVAAVAYGYALFYMVRVMREENMRPLVLSATQALFGVAWAALTLTWQDWGPAPTWSSEVLIALAVLGILNTAVVFTIFVRMVRDDGPVLSSTVLYLVPVVLLLGSVWLEDAPLTALQVVGMLVAAVGVLVARLGAGTDRPAGPAKPADVDAEAAGPDAPARPVTPAGSRPSGSVSRTAAHRRAI